MQLGVQPLCSPILFPEQTLSFSASAHRQLGKRGNGQPGYEVVCGLGVNGTTAPLAIALAGLVFLQREKAPVLVRLERRAANFYMNSY